MNAFVKKSIVSVVALSMLAPSFAFAAPRPQQRESAAQTIKFHEVRNFSGEIQRDPNWCWAACIAMVLHTVDITVTQEQIVVGTYGRLISQGATLSTIQRDLEGISSDESTHVSSRFYGRMLTADEIKAAVDNGNAIIAAVTFSPDRPTSHVSVVYGYGKDDQGNMYVRIYDPTLGDMKVRLDGIWGWKASILVQHHDSEN